MRVVIIGASEIGIDTARRLLNRGHEVVIVDTNREKIQELSDTLPCGFLQGDGSKPKILREAGPKETDILYCLTDNDLVNIIASVVGKTTGFARIVTRIREPEFEDVCAELGLENVIIPTQTVSRFLADLAAGTDILELSTMVKGEARFFSFTVKDVDAGKKIGDLDLPGQSRIVCYYRRDDFKLPEPEESLEKGDEVVIVTHSSRIGELRERWSPHATEGTSNSGDKKEKRKSDR